MGMLRNISQFLIDEGTKILGCAPQFPRFISEVELRKGIYECVNLKKENNYMGRSIQKTEKRMVLIMMIWSFLLVQ